jgi:hypothetical protein
VQRNVQHCTPITIAAILISDRLGEEVKKKKLPVLFLGANKFAVKSGHSLTPW